MCASRKRAEQRHSAHTNAPVLLADDVRRRATMFSDAILLTSVASAAPEEALRARHNFRNRSGQMLLNSLSPAAWFPKQCELRACRDTIHRDKPLEYTRRKVTRNDCCSTGSQQTCSQGYRVSNLGIHCHKKFHFAYLYCCTREEPEVPESSSLPTVSDALPPGAAVRIWPGPKWLDANETLASHVRPQQTSTLDTSLVLLRTTALGISQPGFAAHVRALLSELGSRLRLLVDITFCAGASCRPGQRWFCRLSGLRRSAVWSYRASDLIERWPAVEWPVPLLESDSEANRASGEGAFRGAMELGQVQAWLGCAVAHFMLGLNQTEWPVDDRGGEEAAGAEAQTARSMSSACAARSPQPTPRASSGLLRLVPFLVHEPSVVLWWLKHEAGRTGPPSPLWVVEDDLHFFGNITAYFSKADSAAGPKDHLAVFAPGAADCLPQLMPSLPWYVWTGKPRHCVRAPKQSSLLNWPRHKWEHLERFTPRLLAALDTALEHGVVAHGELFSSSLCASLSWCTAADLRTLTWPRQDGLAVAEKKVEWDRTEGERGVIIGAAALAANDGKWRHLSRTALCRVRADASTCRGPQQQTLRAGRCRADWPRVLSLAAGMAQGWSLARAIQLDTQTCFYLKTPLVGFDAAAGQG